MKKLLRCYLILLLLAALPASAQLDRSKIPPPGPVPAVSFPDYDLVRTANGIRVIIVKDSKLPAISLRLLIDRKPVLEGDYAGGIAIAGEMLMRGTTTRSKDQLDEEIDLIGAKIGSSGTSVFASGLSRSTEKIFELVSVITLHPSFPQEEVDKVITQTVSGLKYRKTEPSAIVGVVRQRALFGSKHPYGDVETEETVHKINREKCLEIYRTYFKPNAAILAVVGDVDKNNVLKLVEKYFGSWATGSIPVNNYPPPKPLDRVTVAFVDRPSSVQSVIRVTETVLLPRVSPDVAPAEVMNTILGGGASFRLFANLREKHAYTYGAYSSLAPDELVGAFTASTSAKNPVTDAAIAEIFAEIRRIRDEPVSGAELERAKNYISGGFVRSLESAGTVAEDAIAIERYGLPKDYYKTFLKRIAAVTSNEVQRVARQYLQPDKMLVAVVGAGKEVKAKLAAFGPIELYDEDGQRLEEKPAAAITITPKEIFDGFLDKTGGKDKLRGLKDKTLELSGKLNDFDMKVKIVHKAPNKYYQEVSLGPMQQRNAFDGTQGWTASPEGVVVPTGEQLEAMKTESAFDFYSAYPQLGYQAEVAGIKSVKGKECYEVVFTKASAPPLRHYFSTVDFLKWREVTALNTPNGPVEQTVDVVDYKNFNGLLAPGHIETTIMGQVISLTTDRFEVNAGVDDKLFEKPASK